MLRLCFDPKKVHGIRHLLPKGKVNPVRGLAELEYCMPDSTMKKAIYTYGHALHNKESRFHNLFTQRGCDDKDAASQGTPGKDAVISGKHKAAPGDDKVPPSPESPAKGKASYYI